MPAPFPGIDPFLESQGYWPDFHARTITYCCDAISDVLPDHYGAQIEERIQLIERDPRDLKVVRPDLIVDKASGPRMDRGGVMVLDVEPTTIPVILLEELRETFIEITRRPDRRLVSVVELLSPDNKAGSGSGQYLAKRDALLRSPVHLVELDFLIGGRRLPMARPLPPGDAFALVSRGDRRPDCEVYAWSIRRPLSAIRLPLQAPDPDLLLDLAAIYATAFERGRYARSIDYEAPLSIPLAPDDRAWAEERARSPR